MNLQDIESFAQAEAVLAEMAFALFAQDPSLALGAAPVRAEEETRSHVATMTEGLIVVDDQGIVCGFNEAAEQIFELGQKDVVGHDASVLLGTHGADSIPAIAFSPAPSSEKKVLTVSPAVVGRRRGGGTLPIDIRVADVVIEGRQLFFLHVNDLVKKHRLEAPIRRAEARYRALVEQIPAVTFMAALDDGENEMYVSPQIESLIGFSQREWLDDPVLWFKRLHPDDQELWNQEFARGIAAGGPFQAECRVIARDGRTVWIHGEARVVRDDAGRPILLQGICFDITESKRAAQQIREAQEAKVRNERLAAVGRLAAGIGHDIRNPLAAIRNAMYYIQKRLSATALGSDARITQFLGIVDKELHTCTTIVGDLLDYARERPPALSACPLAPLVADAISVVPAPAHVSIVNDVPSTLPVPELDQVQFRQVLVNLIQNAAEAIPTDRAGVVRVVGSATETEIVLAVSDNGSGIPDEDLEKIFEPLFTSKVKGTGLGLSIVANTITRHAGKLEIQSSKGVGTTFTVRLPWRGPKGAS